jgi:hypothetical protein
MVMLAIYLWHLFMLMRVGIYLYHSNHVLIKFDQLKFAVNYVARICYPGSISRFKYVSDTDTARIRIDGRIRVSWN